MFVNYLKALLKAALKILKALLKTILKILFKPFKNIIPVNLKNIELWEANFKNCSLLNSFLRNYIFKNPTINHKGKMRNGMNPIIKK